MRTSLATLVAAALLTPIATHAKPVTYVFQGTVSTVTLNENNQVRNATVGDAVTGRLTFDDTVADTNATAGTGEYDQTGFIEMTLEGVRYRHRDPTTFITVVNGADDSFEVAGDHTATSTSGYSFGNFGILLDDTNATALSNDDIPASFNLASWTTERFNIVGQHIASGNDFNLRGNLSSLTRIYNNHGDHDNDLTRDLLWRNTTTGANRVWLFDDNAYAGMVLLSPFASLPYQARAFADFNADGQSDILWQHGSKGLSRLWLMSGTTHTIVVLPPRVASWAVAAAGDLTGDGKADIVWRNYATGANEVTAFNGTALTANTALPTVAGSTMRVAGIMDADGDGWLDLLWRNAANGDLSVWYMDGTTRTATAAITGKMNTAWWVAAVGDFKGDGSKTILFRNVLDGRLAMRTLTGTTLGAVTYLTTSMSTRWLPAGIEAAPR